MYLISNWCVPAKSILGWSPAVLCMQINHTIFSCVLLGYSCSYQLHVNWSLNKSQLMEGDRCCHFFSSGSAAQRRLWPSCTMRFRDHTQRCATVSRTPLDEWSAHHRDLYLTTHTTSIHTPSGIRTHDCSRQAAVDLRPRPHGHWDQMSYWLICLTALIDFVHKLILEILDPTHTHIHTKTHTHKHTHIYIHTYIQTHTYTLSLSLSRSMLFSLVVDSGLHN
jgi:hypothetical protein